MKAQTVYSKFKNIADTIPDSPAIIEEERMFSFKELSCMIDEIADWLGDIEGKYIGIVMDHGAAQIATILGVLKAGGAYVPAEPSLPEERIRYMMKNAGVETVIYSGFDFENPKSRISSDKSTPSGAAYVLYTSGTTGKPKGIIVENHSIANYVEAFQEEFGIGEGDVMLQYSVCSFDIFVEEVFASLLNGAALAIPPHKIRGGQISGLIDFIKRHSVTIIDGFPYLLAELNKLKRLPESVHLLISGGDVLRESYINNLKKQNVRIYNTYGPSETTVCSNYFRVDNSRPLADGTYPVGKSIKGVTVKILDADMRELPEGEAGEICIFGEGVSRGYIGNPPESVNFKTDSLGNKFYRSGDIGYRMHDGNIEFLHRRDNQVMILGKRVEPDEVENVLNSSPDVDKGIVRAFLDEKGLSYLVAYVIPKKKISLHAIKKWMKSKLTDFMIPEFFVVLKKLPLTVRGKVDCDALPVILKEGGIK